MKNIKKLAQSGFSHIELLIILVVVAALVGVGVLVYKNNSTSHAGGSNYHYLTTVTRKDNSIVAIFGCYQSPMNAVASSTVSGAASTSVSSNTNLYQKINIQAYVYPGASSTVSSKRYTLKLTDYYFTTQTNVFSKTSNGLLANLTLTDINNVAANKAFAQVSLLSENGATTIFKFPYKQASFNCSYADPASSAAASVPTSATSYVTSATVSAPVSVFVTQE